jgi:hypothetical protein
MLCTRWLALQCYARDTTVVVYILKVTLEKLYHKYLGLKNVLVSYSLQQESTNRCL